ncbi:MAG TPA: hypothetical protein VFR64_08190 [Methylomirabilota bacterium]|nr:hypothetical protein [Methylomirabilota bacterium]
MPNSLTDWLQKSRLTVVSVDATRGRLRVRGEADLCSELSCGEGTLVVANEGEGNLEALNPGDIIKVEPKSGGAQTITVLRRAWEEIASPEV